MMADIVDRLMEVRTRSFRERDRGAMTFAAGEIVRLRFALLEISSRARFELDHPTEMRDTAFSLIEKTALAALPPKDDHSET